MLIHRLLPEHPGATSIGAGAHVDRGDRSRGGPLTLSPYRREDPLADWLELPLCRRYAVACFVRLNGQEGAGPLNGIQACWALGRVRGGGYQVLGAWWGDTTPLEEQIARDLRARGVERIDLVHLEQPLDIEGMPSGDSRVARWVFRGDGRSSQGGEAAATSRWWRQSPPVLNARLGRQLVGTLGMAAQIQRGLSKTLRTRSRHGSDEPVATSLVLALQRADACLP